MKPLVLSPAQQAEAIGNLVAVRALGTEMFNLYSGFGGKDAASAAQGAERLVTAIDRVLELLEAPSSLLEGRP
jgi:hypothetical protein